MPVEKRTTPKQAHDPACGLTAIDGIGDKMALRLLKHFGSCEEVVAAAKRLEIDRFAEMDGVGRGRAISLVKNLIGDAAHSFLKTERVEAIYDDIISLAGSYSSTDYAKNKISLLTPLPRERKKEMDERMGFVLSARDEVARLDIPLVRSMLSKIHRPKEPRTVRSPGRVILVESENDYERLRGEGISNFCEMTTPDYASGLHEYDLVVYAYERGELDVSGLDNIVMVPSGCKSFEMAPESVLSFFASNLSLMENIAVLSGHLGRESVSRRVMEILGNLKKEDINTADLERKVQGITDLMNDRLSERMKNIQLSGSDVLQVMGQGMPAAVKAVYDDVIREGSAKLRSIGLNVSITPSYPLKIEEDELERALKKLCSQKSREYFEFAVRAARELVPMRKKIEEEIQSALEFDYRFSLGCFALDYGLVKPEICDSYDLESCVHLNIAQKHDAVRVDYQFGNPDNIVLLTGANSGGKTTLLETISQIVIMTHMGLPVCAGAARVELVDELYFFAHKRSLSAGAFETFLRGFMPVVVSEKKKLVLADELEAMTELEAASKIIATFMEFLKNTDSKGVIVTHMAGEIGKFVKVRIDGIDAGGLDDDYNLVVDRTPKIGHHARSTPELIVKKLEMTTTGREREIYSSIMKKF
ncbi:MAG: DNA mismatch repair protein MutS [Thermoplasmata archaeon HGW-Thermoplasmata-1]|nr:MAG: DNA mismatch repair protein MutS [Thermoplasmata archaeon HGW-Thermoplasmata-1]